MFSGEAYGRLIAMLRPLASRHPYLYTLLFVGLVFTPAIVGLVWLAAVLQGASLDWSGVCQLLAVMDAAFLGLLYGSFRNQEPRTKILRALLFATVSVSVLVILQRFIGPTSPANDLASDAFYFVAVWGFLVFVFRLAANDVVDE